jgi:endonuclease YncB( thermonuclease family)
MSAVAAASTPRRSFGADDANVERFRPHRGANTPDLSRALDGVETLARVVSLHDGDTLTAVFPSFGAFYQLHVRVDGIDTCEMNAVAPPNRALALRARDRMLQLVVGHGASTAQPADTKARIDALLDSDVFVVRVRCGRMDKYGRLLGKVSSAYSDALSPTFGDMLIAEHLAYEYHGGKKLSEAEQLSAMGYDAGGERPPATKAEGGFWQTRWSGWMPQGWMHGDVGGQEERPMLSPAANNP